MSNTSNKIRAEAATAAIALLTELFPRTFAVYEARRQPLKIGIDKDLVSAVAGAIKPHELTSALAFYTGNAGYLRGLRVGAVRIDLDGNPAGTVTASEAQHAAEVLATRLLRTARRRTAGAKPAATNLGAPPAQPERLGLAGLKAAWRERQKRQKGQGEQS